MSKELEDKFYEKEFNFSYSSLNKLLFSPSLFYKEYILKDREQKIEKHLIEGSAIHCLLFEPDNFKNKFRVVPEKAPSDNVRKVLHDMSLHTDETDLMKVEDFVILDSLKAINLYQSLKTDEQRLSKIKLAEYQVYWEFVSNNIIDVIDQDTYQRCLDRVEILKNNEEVSQAFAPKQTDFELDPITTYAEAYLTSELKDYPFGLHGYVDFYEVNTETKTATIYDLKTTSKSINDFADTVEFYNYWLQAAIYSKLVFDNLEDDTYTIKFNFVVIDAYDQVYIFEVSEATMNEWTTELLSAVMAAKHHYDTKNYSLPYEFLVRKVNL